MTQSVVVQGKTPWEDGESVAAKRSGVVYCLMSIFFSFSRAVGQCGNQIGCCFWDLALREHAAVNQVPAREETTPPPGLPLVTEALPKNRDDSIGAFIWPI